MSWQSFKAEGVSIVEKLKEILREGNARRVVVEHEGRTIAEFPLTVGVVGAVLAPIAAAIGALVALVQDCTIRVERESGEEANEEAPPVTPQGPSAPG
ncbi:hypothetical protein BH24ACI4_BH24ACI4_33160 [soil metagenome]